MTEKRKERARIDWFGALLFFVIAGTAGWNVIQPYTGDGVSMAIAPLALAGIAGASSLFSNLLGNRFGRQKTPYASPDEVNLQAPERGNYVFSPDELARINSSAIDRLMRGGAMTQRNITTTGAATGAPQGAVLDSLSGANYNLGRGHAELSGNLARLNMQGKQNYADARQRYDLAQADIRRRYFEGKREADNARSGQWGDLFGSLGKIGTLYGAGYFG